MGYRGTGVRHTGVRECGGSTEIKGTRGGNGVMNGPFPFAKLFCGSRFTACTVPCVPLTSSAMYLCSALVKELCVAFPYR